MKLENQSHPIECRIDCLICIPRSTGDHVAVCSTCCSNGRTGVLFSVSMKSCQLSYGIEFYTTYGNAACIYKTSHPALSPNLHLSKYSSIDVWSAVASPDLPQSQSGRRRPGTMGMTNNFSLTPITRLICNYWRECLSATAMLYTAGGYNQASAHLH